MGNQATVPPLSWKKVGLAILPGVYLLAVTMLDLTYLGIWPNIVFVAGCAMVVLMGVWQERTLPVWCYPLCGLMICVSWLVTAGLPWLLAVFAIAILLSWGYTFASLAAVWKQVSWVSWMLLGVILLTAIVTAALMLLPHRQWPGWLLWLLPFVGTPAMPFTSWLALALVPLARRQGLRTALLVLGVGFWMWMFSLDFNYSLAGSAWANLMNTIWTATVLVAAPLWVLRARTARQRQWGLILPMLLALVAIVPLEAIARHAPDLLAGYVDLFRFGPDTGAMVAGIGTRPRAELMAGLLRNLAQAGAVLLHWLIVVILFNSLERMPSDSGQLPLSNLRNRAVNAFVVR